MSCAPASGSAWASRPLSEGVDRNAIPPHQFIFNCGALPFPASIRRKRQPREKGLNPLEPKDSTAGRLTNRGLFR